MDKKQSRLEERMNADERLKPFLFFLYATLDVCKLAAGENEERAQAARNLAYLAFEKWGWALLKNIEEG